MHKENNQIRYCVTFSYVFSKGGGFEPSVASHLEDIQPVTTKKTEEENNESY